ncbi:MAG: putative inosine-5-monophosphate dehydrogenase dehydrogenase, partial [Gammaproteobacteria bacterium]|nr:putative inosine-5-monophosphate dehydrogenase dehydrogenase [Gammaproteobacteria bacterium]
ILGGHSVLMAGWTFALVPVALNSLLLVTCGWAFHKFSRHAYPHRSEPISSPTAAEDLNAALTEFGEPLDIQEADLDRLLRQVEIHALARANAAITCADIMSGNVISIGETAAPDAAKALLLRHGFRVLPVIDRTGSLRGTVGWHDLAKGGNCVADLMSAATVYPPQAPAFELLSRLTNGPTHAVVIVDHAGHVRGIVTQTDLLVAMSRVLAAHDVTAPTDR